MSNPIKSTRRELFSKAAGGDWRVRAAAVVGKPYGQ